MMGRSGQTETVILKIVEEITNPETVQTFSQMTQLNVKILMVMVTEIMLQVTTAMRSSSTQHSGRILMAMDTGTITELVR